MRDAISHASPQPLRGAPLPLSWSEPTSFSSAADKTPSETVETFVAYRGTTAAGIDVGATALPGVAEGQSAALQKSVSIGQRT